ncbi:GNAT family N-acetyltransferase [Roseobacter litoralis]|uniref:GNAT family N-acetyltransferase n=1 Tax=Roseobacter litoralis TaxID=42443 RepID=UPI002494539A|nr:GNAT family N-acetyltransferase [Roseobacter litoralis]
MTPTDRYLLEIGFAHLSDRARYFRFLGAHKNLSEKELDTFTAINGPDHVAVGALLKDRAIPEPIGIARYIRLPDQKHVAEIAITIADQYQHKGLGSLLLGVLAKFARQGGITEFTALVHSENTAMLGLLDQFGGVQTALGGEDIEVTFPVSAISVQVPTSTADNHETLGGAARAIINRTSAKLRQFVSFHPELSEINAPDQPTSVWENEGGAIVPSVRRT